MSVKWATRAARVMRQHEWHLPAREGSLRGRAYGVVANYRTWWDWGHPVMALVGRNDSGSWGVPRGRDLWFRPTPDGRGFITTTDYNDVRDSNDGEWRIFDWQDDGHTIIVGWWPAPGEGNIQRSGVNGRRECHLFVRWLVWDGLVKAEWLGLRRWLYFKALHAVVNDKKPFTCQAVPPNGSGGYRHWHCQLKKRHAGNHRFRNYIWPEGERVTYAPTDPANWGAA